MRRLFTITAALLALACAAPSTYARTVAGAEVPSPRALVLAHEIVAAENAADRFSRMWSNTPDIIWIQIIRALGVDDPALGQKIRVLVATNLETIGAEIAEARVQALAQTYTVGEMEGMLAFRRSPVGQAYYRAAPDLSRARQAMSQGAAPEGRDADAPALSPRRLDLIRRMLAAQDEKGQARRAGQAARSVLRALTSDPWATSSSAPDSPTAADEAKDDVLVRRMEAIDIRFYAKTFTDEQLAAITGYFEGPTGRATVAREPQLAHLWVAGAEQVFIRRTEQIEKEACAAAACNATQQKALGAYLKVARAMEVLVLKAGAQLGVAPGLPGIGP